MALEITDSNFQEILAEGKPVVMDFWAPWCGPCKMVGPIIDELATEYEGKVIIGKCDVDDNPELAQKYRITSIPAFVGIKNGEVVLSRVGAMSSGDFASVCDSLL